MQNAKGKKTHQKLLSVIVPAYKEKTIKKDLEIVDETLRAGLPAEYNYEIICVVDGSPDDTESQAKKVKSDKVKVFSYPDNRGKGYALKFGMEKSKGDLVSFLDAGREIHSTGMMMLMAHMDWYKADVIVGSKMHPVSRVKYPLFRRLMSLGYYLLMKILLNIPVRDTQSGIKIFKRKVVEKILPKLTVERYAADVEMLALARYFGFDRIFEAPVEIQYRFDSLTHASTLRGILRMIWDTLGVFWRLKIVHSYD